MPGFRRKADPSTRKTNVHAAAVRVVVGMESVSGGIEVQVEHTPGESISFDQVEVRSGRFCFSGAELTEVDVAVQAVPIRPAADS